MNKRFGLSLFHRNGHARISLPAGLGLAFGGILVLAAGALALTALTAPLSPQGTIVNAHKVTSIVASFVRSDPGSNDTVVAEFSARISLTGSGNEHVRYRWRRSDGGAAPWKEIAFNTAGNQTVTTKWAIGFTHAGQTIWESVETNYPNAMTSNQAKFLVPSQGFKVTGVRSQVVPYEWTGICPKKFDVTSQITVAGSGVVKYHWVRSDGGSGPQLDLPFGASGTQTVQSSWTVSNPEFDQGVRRWLTVEIISPNHLLPPPDDAPATAPRPYAPIFFLTCKDFAQNPNVPVQISVNIAGMAVQPSYNCKIGNPSPLPSNWISGHVTVRNLSANPLLCIKDNQRLLSVVVIHPVKKEALNGTPPWPYARNDNWHPYALWIPDKIAPHDQFTTDLGTCLPVFDRHPVVYIGASYRDPGTGKNTLSNLVKWETKF